MGAVKWGGDIAQIYDRVFSATFEPAVLDPIVSTLAELAAGGPALEFAVGTGRVALPLSAGGISVHGIELSPAMVDELRRKPGAERIRLTIGDMCSAHVEGDFRLVYLVFNTIMNVTTQEEQVAVFVNAARHLQPGGVFVVEVLVPQVPGDLRRVFAMEPEHVGIETFDDTLGQIAWSHHWMQVDGRLVRHSAPYRYVWPAELDLMARLAGLHPRDRWSGWQRRPFSDQSTNHVVVYEKPS